MFNLLFCHSPFLLILGEECVAPGSSAKFLNILHVFECRRTKCGLNLFTAWKYCCQYSSSGVLKLCAGAPASSSRRGIFLGRGKTMLSKPKSAVAAVVFSQNSVNHSQRAFMSVSIISLVLCMCSWCFWRATLTVSMQENKLSMSFKEKKILNFCRCSSSPLALPAASPFSFELRTFGKSISAL